MTCNMAVVSVFSCVLIAILLSHTKPTGYCLIPRASLTVAVFNETFSSRLYRLVATCNESTRASHCLTLPQCYLHQLAPVLLWCRPSHLHSAPFKPRPFRSLMSVFVALLLLSGNVEPNPGPPPSNNSITLGCFNARSVQSKAALIHDLISDNNIDILALQETWLPPYAHPAVKCDIAPPGYVVRVGRRSPVARCHI